ncbi:MAG: flagellar basal body L-ring protein FlgH, partial [Acetobacteraceae bacterium]
MKPASVTLARIGILMLLPILSGCGMVQRLAEVGSPPALSPITDPTQNPGYRPVVMPMPPPLPPHPDSDSLWQQGSRAFFQRAARVGDLVTVVVDMNDAANFKNVTSAVRNANENAGIANLFGLENYMTRAGMT